MGRPIERIRPRQKHSDLKKLLAEAADARPEFEDFLKKLAEKYECDFKIGDLKTEASVLNTVSYKQESKNANNLLDYCRGILVIENDELGKIEQIARQLNPNKNSQIKGIADWVSKPTNNGFRGLFIYPEMPNGHIVEIVVIPRSVERVYDLTHGLSKNIKDMFNRCNREGWGSGDEEKYEALWKKIVDIHAQATTPELKNLSLTYDD